MSVKEILFSFKGRISRSTYWYAGLGLTVVNFICIFVIVQLSNELAIALCAFWLWPSLAICAKRWHDRDKSAWWLLIGFIPLVGPFWVLIECGFLKGTHGSNRFGEDPLLETENQ